MREYAVTVSNPLPGVAETSHERQATETLFVDVGAGLQEVYQYSAHPTRSTGLGEVGEAINESANENRSIVYSLEKPIDEGDTFDQVRNFGAGIANSLIPGSNLGDSRSNYRNIGETIGGVASAFVNPLDIISKTGMGVNLGKIVNTIGDISSIADSFNLDVATLLGFPSTATRNPTVAKGGQNLASTGPLLDVPAQTQLQPIGNDFNGNPLAKNVSMVDTAQGASYGLLIGVLIALYFAFKSR